MAYSRACKWR